MLRHVVVETLLRRPAATGPDEQVHRLDAELLTAPQQLLQHDLADETVQPVSRTRAP
jgi:hypothetical protein